MKQSLTKKLLTSCLVLSLVTFLSCGHQQKQGDSGLFSDLGGGESGTSDSAQYSEESIPSDVAPTERSTTSSADLEATLDSQSSDTASDPLALAPMEDIGASTGSDLGATTEGSATAALDLSTPPMEATPTESMPSPLLEPMPEATAGEGIASNIVGSEEPPAPSLSMEEAPAFTEAKPVVTVAVRTPELPKESVWRKGQTLNRYYFLRHQDTAEEVSQMIFGNEAQAETLKSMNPGKWSAGKIVLYVSPENPKDAEMQSFYEERGVSPEEYTVQKGDWLSKISTNTYGSALSWKEIAAVNGLKDPNQLKVGMKISLYPAQMPTSKMHDKVAVKVVEENEEIPEVVSKPEDPAQVDPPKQSEPRAELSKAKPELASPEVGSFFEQNFALVVSGLAFLMAAYFIRRRMSRASELSE